MPSPSGLRHLLARGAIGRWTSLGINLHLRRQFFHSRNHRKARARVRLILADAIASKKYDLIFLLDVVELIVNDRVFNEFA